MTEGTLVRGRYVITGDDPLPIGEGAVRIAGDRIVAVGSWEDLRAAHPSDAVAGGANDIVTPGFVNTHGHFSEGLITGLAKDHTLWEWVGALVEPVSPHLDYGSAYLGTLIAGMQMLRSGITLANDMFVCDPRPGGPTTTGVVDALDELGLRGEVSFGAGDVRGASIGAIMEEHSALEEAAAASHLSRFRVGIAAIGAQSDELFQQSAALATETGAGSHIHLQEIREEVTAVRGRHGVTPIEHCARSGLFSAPTIAAHCVWVDRADRELLAAHGVG
ncbi:MAG: amidohydrolase family protein, partial [Actinomycetota bacterium]